MDAQQVVLNFLTATESSDPAQAAAYLADDLVFEGGAMIRHGRAEGVALIGNALRAAMPDFKWNVQAMATLGDRVIVALRWGGTH